MTLDSDIADHYAAGDLLAAIQAGVEALGKSPATIELADLAPVDEFHVGGRPATTDLGEHLDLTAGMGLLDIGCGIGGAARFFASTFGCQVTGIDLTPEFVDVARSLTDWTGLTERVRYEVCSALDMPFEDAAFDCATQIHIGMNIPDKTALFAEVHRVLRPGAAFGVYDIMQLGVGEVAYPVPWASNASTSFVEDAQAYRDALEAAGFVITAERERRQFAVDFFAALKAGMAGEGGPPPLGLHLHMGPDSPRKIANMVDAIGAGIVAPVEIIARKG